MRRRLQPPGARPIPFSQRGYLWQRDWNPPVLEAMSEGERKLDGVVLLGGELLWSGSAPHGTRLDSLGGAA